MPNRTTGEKKMAERPFAQADLDVLERIVCPHPKAKPIVGVSQVGMTQPTGQPRCRGPRILANLGNPVAFRVHELRELVTEVTDAKSRFFHPAVLQDDLRKWWLDITLASCKLGSAPHASEPLDCAA